MDKLTIADPSIDELQRDSSSSKNSVDAAGASSFIIVDLDEEDEGSYECCRVS